jgi:limonene-1,2-epoxide hydrolase
VAGVFEVDADGRISLWRDYFDMASYTGQLAALTDDR